MGRFGFLASSPWSARHYVDCRPQAEVRERLFRGPESGGSASALRRPWAFVATLTTRLRPGPRTSKVLDSVGCASAPSTTLIGGAPTSPCASTFQPARSSSTGAVAVRTAAPVSNGSGESRLCGAWVGGRPRPGWLPPRGSSHAGSCTGIGLQPGQMRYLGSVCDVGNRAVRLQSGSRADLQSSHTI